MTFFVEISNPPQWRFWRFRSDSMYRFGFAWIAIGVLRVPFRRFCETAYDWEST